MRPFGHDARDQRNALHVQFVRQPLHRDGLDERIGDDDLLLARRCRVAVERRLDIRLQNFTDLRQALQKFQRQFVRLGRHVLFGETMGRMVFERLADFVLQRAEYGIQQRRRLHLDLGGMDQLFVKKIRETTAATGRRSGR